MLSSLRNSSFSFRVIAALQGIAAITILLMGFLPSFQRAWMDQMNLSTESYPLWALLQPIPKMYNFENRIFLQVVYEGELHSEWEYYANHYSPRILTFGLYPHLVTYHEVSYRLFIETRFRSVCKTYYFELSARDQIPELWRLQEPPQEMMSFIGSGGCDDR